MLDTARYRDCTYMSCCHWKGVPQDVYQQVIYIFYSLGLLGGLPSISSSFMVLGLSCFQSSAIIYSELSIVPFSLTKNLIQIYSFPSREFIIFLVPLLPFQVVVLGTLGVYSFVFISSMLPCIPILVLYFAIIPCSLLQYYLACIQ